MIVPVYKHENSQQAGAFLFFGGTEGDGVCDKTGQRKV